MDNFDEYLRQGEPNKAEKAKVWKTAIGLQQVDGLKPSEYLIETAKQNIEGDTPLHLAAESGKDNLEVVQLLVEAGADVNAVNKRGDTPRKAAKGRKVKKYLKDNGGARKIKN